MSNVVTLFATITAKPEYAAELEKELLILVEKSNQEAGCVGYVLHKDLSDSNNFIMYENWQNEAAVELHNNSEHFQKFVKLAEYMLSNLQVVKASKI